MVELPLTCMVDTHYPGEVSESMVHRPTVLASPTDVVLNNGSPGTNNADLKPPANQRLLQVLQRSVPY